MEREERDGGRGEEGGREGRRREDEEEVGTSCMAKLLQDRKLVVLYHMLFLVEGCPTTKLKSLRHHF